MRIRGCYICIFEAVELWSAERKNSELNVVKKLKIGYNKESIVIFETRKEKRAMTEKKSASWGCRCGETGNMETMCCFAGAEETVMKPPLLLHSCCGPCSTSVIERLAPDYEVTVFFYNPCITDREEYEKRKENQIAFIERFNQNCGGRQKIHFMEGIYEPENFFELTEGLSQEPEGGARCTVCFRQRLSKTAETTADKGFRLFTTTLSVSPHKNYPLISAIGCECAEKYGTEFLDLDFKKKAGFQRSIQLSKEYGLYRQNYCGCEFSKR